MPDRYSGGVMHTITADLACFGCGYNLRGLSSGAACPECGKPVEDSLRGDRLAQADKRWLGILRLGLLCAIGSEAVKIVRYIFWVCQTVWPTFATPSSQVDASVWLAIYGHFAMTAGAVFLITWTEPRMMMSRRWLSVANLARAGFVLSIVISELTRYVVSRQPLGYPSARMIAYFIVNGTANLFGIVSMAAIFILLRRLTQRIPHSGLTRFARGMTVLLCVYGLLQITQSARLAAATSIHAFTSWASIAYTSLGGLLSLPTIVLAVTCLHELGRAIAAQLEDTPRSA